VRHIRSLQVPYASKAVCLLSSTIKIKAAQSAARFYMVLEMGLESYRFSTPFGYILLSVKSISKGLQVRVTDLLRQTLHHLQHIKIKAR
jgi:hypothetical protein